MARDRDELDPTWIRNQPALTSSNGRVWLGIGGLLAMISVIVLIALATLSNPGVALIGASLVVALYVAMIAAQFMTPPGRLRLGTQATLMLTMAVAALTCVIIVSAGEWGGV